jgi:hypothetical protein
MLLEGELVGLALYLGLVFCVGIAVTDIASPGQARDKVTPTAKMTSREGTPPKFGTRAFRALLKDHYEVTGTPVDATYQTTTHCDSPYSKVFCSPILDPTYPLGFAGTGPVTAATRPPPIAARFRPTRPTAGPPSEWSQKGGAWYWQGAGEEAAPGRGCGPPERQIAEGMIETCGKGRV